MAKQSDYRRGSFTSVQKMVCQIPSSPGWKSVGQIVGMWALTLGTKDCMYQRNSRCYELVVGPPGEPVIIETSKEANWVNRYTIPE